MRLFVIASLLGLPVAALAQDGTPDLRFTAGAGVSVSPEYFGSSDYSAGPTGSFRLGYAQIGPFSFGRLDGAETRGLSYGAAFRFVPERSADEFPELEGLDPIDATAEVGGSVSYQAEYATLFAELRYGFFGHESLVGTIGGDLVARPTERLTLRAGPRLEIGSADFNQTYFGVTADEASSSAFSEYTPSAGLYAAGLEVEAEYDIDARWSVVGIVSYQKLVGEAEDSPIVAQGDADQFGVSLVVRRTFDWDFR